MSASVFVNYRREDAGDQAGRIADSLRHFLGAGEVFLDSSSIEPGAKWPHVLEEALRAAKVVVVVVGPRWLLTANEWGERRIFEPGDWTRSEIELALAEGKKVVPVSVGGSSPMMKAKLPESVSALADLQCLELRRDHWAHDIMLLISAIQLRELARESSGIDVSPYPEPAVDRPDPLSVEKIALALERSIPQWSWRTQKFDFGGAHIREEFYRRLDFPSFQAAVKYMSEVAPGCDIANHHPHWENIFRSVYIHLTTFDIGHRISDRDVQLAKYLDKAFDEFSKKN